MKTVSAGKDILDSTPIVPKPELDHRNYGAWYLHPTKWEKRFQNLSDPKAIDIVKSRILLKKENQDQAKQPSHQQQEKVYLRKRGLKKVI